MEEQNDVESLDGTKLINYSVKMLIARCFNLLNMLLTIQRSMDVFDRSVSLIVTYVITAIFKLARSVESVSNNNDDSPPNEQN
jgi:hypothetical protein